MPLQRESRRRAATSSKPPHDPVTAYAQSVLSGQVLAGPDVRNACARHMRDLESAEERGWHFDLQRVEWAIGYFRDVLKLNGGSFEGEPFVLSPWQEFIVGSIFGWVDDDGWRRFWTAYIEVSKGSGKSPLAAGIGLLCLTSDNEHRAEVYAAATKKDQAMILFRDAVAMVDQSPELHSRLVQTGGKRPWNLSYPRLNAFFRAISNDTGQSGPRPHCSLVDELHEHPNGDCVDMLKLGQKGRRQPLLVEITNSGFDRTSICYDHHEYSQRVCAGERDDDRWFAYVCGMDEGDDPINDESVWIKANPNLGVSIQPEYIRTQVREALGMPAKLSKVKRLNFCMWVDADNPWIDGDLWLEAEQEFDALAELEQLDEVWGALDLSGSTDLTSLSLGGERPDGTIVAMNEFWTPKDTLIERARKDKQPYDLWVEQGYMTATPGRNVDYGFVAQRIGELKARLPNLKAIAFDTYRIKYLEKELDEQGIEVMLIAHPQGYYKAADLTEEEKKRRAKAGELEKPNMWMPHSVELLEKCVGERKLRVKRNPVLTFASASAVQEPDAKNNRIFSKRKSRGRIDGIVTLAMLHGIIEARPSPPPPRKYQMFTIGA